MNLSQYRLDEKLLTIFEHLTDEQKIEKAIQEYSIQDVVRIFTYYELEQYSYAKKLLLKKHRNNPYALFCYSSEIICGRWLEAEPAIMTDPYYAYLYSREVIKGRWLEAEPTIMTNAEYIYYYSLSIIKGRWPEAEPAIMKHSPYWRFYKDRFNL